MKSDNMKEEWKKPTQHNMKRRALWHNYRYPGVYMITLVTEGRRPLFGRLITSPDPYISLSPLGEQIIKEEIWKIREHYPSVEVWKTCVMPDHLHIIIRINDYIKEGKGLSSVVAGFKYGCTKTYNDVISPNRISDTISGVPSASTGSLTPPLPACNKRVKNTIPLFEKGYNDRILRQDDQLDRWKKYLDDNPRRLALKRANPDLFKVAHGRQIGTFQCQIIGNIFLLDIPDKQAVIVHHADTPEQFAKKKGEWFACGERGGVLVSAAIAPKEKEILTEAMERGYYVISLKDNGFPPLYKPNGRAFDACCRGQLLQVSPWPYKMQKPPLSRTRCLEMNRLAETIAAGI